MVSTVADPVAIYYKLSSTSIALESLYYVPLVGLLVLLVTGWLAVYRTARDGILVPLAGVSVVAATLGMAFLASMDKDTWDINFQHFATSLGTSLPVATFLAVASIALPWWLWHRSQATRQDSKNS